MLSSSDNNLKFKYEHLILHLSKESESPISKYKHILIAVLRDTQVPYWVPATQCFQAKVAISKIVPKVFKKEKLNC